ncbi:biosynthetic arginine decarboxylase [Cohaesibacter celericrescens]|uniref:Arginine decarboxylase n=1 Tax=Cohaesibacter celericrescens TaxID=2067669 RepID=A0A2N5XME5_9HYPH|nr:biosynthetic arginine decarboxylase [Cohaesibacter celericrescens]PLW75587.1 arginine decarboxylase [Cohaesibacter celericrescens]
MEPDAPGAIYGIERWGKGQFEVLDNGNIGLITHHEQGPATTDLTEILHSLEERGIASPILLRVANSLKSRIDHINGNFQAAIKDLDYKAEYRGVFPVKVNQQAHVIEKIVEYGSPYHYGLEVGSKPELIIALSQRLSVESLLICNGIKDSEFINLALLSRKLGFNTIIVLESVSELELVLKESKKLKIRPALGIRIKLNNRITGNWASSSGDRSAFGLSSPDVLHVVDRLKAEGFLDCLQLQHFHLGSQVPDILDVRRSTAEACRYFVELRKEGAPLQYIDLGGGLGIDYTGEHKSTENSINYTTGEYCNNIVEAVKNTMDDAGQAHPIIVTESGRATVAYSSMLLFNILDVTHYNDDADVEIKDDDARPLRDMRDVASYLTPARLQECLNDVTFYRDEVRRNFGRGESGLRDLAKAEKLYLHLISKMRKVAQSDEWISEDVETALEATADIYHANFSLFQSLPDVWAIDQLHPIIPIQRLNEEPTRRAILSDITCDSDGKVDQFVLADGISSSLPIHVLSEGEHYSLAVFFVGAYQETLGDLHNLFGDTNVATIEIQPDGDFNLIHEVEGDTIAEVLRYVEYDPLAMSNSFKAMVEEAVSKKSLTLKERKTMMTAFKESLNGYTYFEH